MAVELVLCDVDFTLLRPHAVFHGEGYTELAARHGVALDASLYEEARLAAIAAVWEAQESLDHDPATHERFASEILRGMGAEPAVAVRLGVEVERAWNEPEHFELFDDARPALTALADAGLAVGLVSNTHRDLEVFLAPFELPFSFALSSRAHGRRKPCPTIFAAALARAAKSAADAVMVGDSLRDDIEGATAAGLRAILLDRHGFHGDVGVERIASLDELPALLAV